MSDTLGAAVSLKSDGKGGTVEQKEFFKRLAEIFDVPEENISLNYKLPAEAWDSIAVLAVTAAIDEIFDVVVSVKSIEKISTVEELMRLIESERSN